MKVLIQILSILTLFALFNSCSTAPEFERNNENDPSNSSFVPDGPSKVEISYIIEPNKDILLAWQDNTENEDGYRVYKSKGEDAEFEFIAQLDKNSTTYLDTSKTIISPLIYQIVTYTNSNESKPLELQIDFGELNYLKFNFNPPNNKLLLSWEDYTTFETSALVEYSFDNVDWIISDTIHTGKNSFTLNYSSFESFDLYIRVSSLLNNFQNDFQVINELTSEKLSIHQPLNFRVETIFEDDVLFTWEDNLSFETGFKIIHTVPDDPNIYEEFVIDANTSSFQTFISTSPRQHQFSLVSLNQSKESKKTILKKYIYAYIESEALRFIEISDQEIQLQWFQIYNARTLEIERSLNSQNNYKVIATLDGNTISFRDTDLDKNKGYSYRLKSTTHTSNPLTINFIELPVYEKTIGSEIYPSILAKLNSINEVLYIRKDYSNNDNNQLILERRNLTTNSTVSQLINSFDRIDKIEVSPNNELIGIYGRQGSGSNSNWLLKVYRNTNLFPLIATYDNISNGINSFTFTHDSEYILQLDYDYGQQEAYSKLLNVEEGTIDKIQKLTKICLESILRHPEVKKYILDCSSSYEILDTNDYSFSTLYGKPTGNSDDEFIVGNSIYLSTSEYPILKIDLETFETEIIESEPNFFLAVIPDKEQFLISYNGLLKIIDSISGETFFIDTDFLGNKSIYKAIYNEEAERIIISTNYQSLEVLEFKGKWSLKE